MICPKCGALYEGDACPYCAEKPQQNPESNFNNYNAQPAQDTTPSSNNTVLFVILGIAGGFLVLATLAFLFIGTTTRTLLSNTNTHDDNSYYAENLPPPEISGASVAEEDIPYDPAADEAAKNEFQQKNGVYKSGDYTVGTDIPAGTYIILSDDMGEYGDFYIGVYASESMSDASKIYGGWSKNSRYVILKEGQYLHFSHSTMYDPELVDITLDPFSDCGMFLVGRDLEPGTYTVVPDNDQYDGTFEVISGLTSSGPFGTKFYYVGLDGSEEITLSEGEYIQTDFCILKK